MTKAVRETSTSKQEEDHGRSRSKRNRGGSEPKPSPKLAPFSRRQTRAEGNVRAKPPLTSSTPTIHEVTEDSGSAPESFSGQPRIQPSQEDSIERAPTEYTRLLPARSKYSRDYSSTKTPSFSGDNVSEGSGISASDESSSNESISSITSGMSRKQLITFLLIMASSLSSSFTVCLFPPFYPKIAELKGATATDYGLIIGTNCLMSFLITPFVGNHLSTIGVKFAFVGGLFGGGVCCALTGFLEFFNSNYLLFIVMSVCIRIFHATSNALVIVSSFTCAATEFPTSVARIFSTSRFVMNVAQLGGPMLGGLIYEFAGFAGPFVIFGCMQILLSAFVFVTMKGSQEDDETGDSVSSALRKRKKKVSVFGMLCIPTVWFSFAAFIVATVCNGFLSINLEPQVLRYFHLTPFYVGFFFGMKDGANSLASLFWGWVCDRNKKSVKPFLIISSFLVSSSFFLLGSSATFGFDIKLTVPLLLAALCLNGAGIGGQQVVGVIDAMHEAAAAGYPDTPETHGMVAGLWSSLSGAGRFVSRGGSGFLVDQFGFNAVASIACGLQAVIAVATFLYLVLFECSLSSRNSRLRTLSVTIVEQGRRRDERVVFTTNSSPSDSVMNHSVHVCIPHSSQGARMINRIANSMPQRRWNNVYTAAQNTSRSMR